MSNERDSEVERERLLRQLFARAKPRPQPPPDDTEEVRRAVLAEWDAVTGARIWRRRAVFGAVAASLLVAAVVYVGGGGPEPSAPAPLVASVERVQGIVAAANGVRVSAGSGIVAGVQLESGEGQAALRLASGGSLRIAPHSRVVLTGGDEAELLAGAVYFDSERSRSSEFVVTTQLGRVRDVGTQFLVRLDDNGLDVGVREGRVTLTRGGAADGAGAGERLVATQIAGDVRRDSIATFGDDWDWAEGLAPPFDINGRTFGEFIAWFEAQTGRTVVFADPAVEGAFRNAVQTGSVDFPPLQKLSAVLAINNLTYALDGERVVISAR
jgi:ferric-dicitrate binding protein FerR (iron transport regulator)